MNTTSTFESGDFLADYTKLTAVEKRVSSFAGSSATSPSIWQYSDWEQEGRGLELSGEESCFF